MYNTLKHFKLKFQEGGLLPLSITNTHDFLPCRLKSYYVIPPPPQREREDKTLRQKILRVHSQSPDAFFLISHNTKHDLRIMKEASSFLGRRREEKKKKIDWIKSS